MFFSHVMTLRAQRLAQGLAVGISLFVSSCGGGGGTSVTGAGARLTGYFKDSAVGGLSYVTSSNVTGVTRPDGGFDYNPGDRVTFFLGEIKFPQVVANSLVTPLNMADGSVDAPLLNNIAYLLQALDADDNPDNGITLSPDLAKLATQPIDFNVDTATFLNNAQLNALIQAKGGSQTTAASALTHINWNLEQGFVDSTVIGPSVDCLYPDQGASSADISLVKKVMASSNRTVLNAQLWADVYAKPQNAAGWFYDATLTLRTPNPVGAFEPYKPTASSPEVLAAMKSRLWHDYSMQRDSWFRHRDEPKVQFRVAALKTYVGLVNQPEYIGNAIFMHYTGDTNTYLELVFDAKLQSTVFFNFTSDNTKVLYDSTLGKDGQVGGDDDGLYLSGSKSWAAQHRPGDVNFPPNLHLGGTTASGRQIPDGTCLIPSGGSALVWTRPSSRVDFYFSTIGVTTPGKGTAPVYNDTQGYQGTVGLYSNENAIHLTIVKP